MNLVKHKIKKEYMDLILSGKKEWEINLFFPHIDSIKDIKKKLHDCGIDRDSKIVYFHIEERLK